MKKFEIWMEGFLATGMEGIPTPASFVGIAEGVDFKDAVTNWYKKNPSSEFDANQLSYWGCRLFETEAEARKTFG